MDLKTQMIEFKVNGGNAPGYLAHPNDNLNYPGVVVLQEWWGLNAHIIEVTERLASSGFYALAPDLYHGAVTEEPDEASKLAMTLDRERAVEECSAAARYLKSLPRVKPPNIGVVGWCMGGGLSLSTAAHNGVIGAAVVFYGRPLEENDTRKLKAPVLGIYGEMDKGIPISLVNDFQKQLENNNTPHEIHIYPDAPHAFFNDTRPQAYRQVDAENAWNKTLDWFRKYLV